jgi:hypothetical protein
MARRYLLTLLSILLAGSVHAQTASDPLGADASAGLAPPIKTVIELFTSQGCSSCPPADTLLKSYAEDKEVLALSLPVDYWDYLGWKDTFATAHNSDRQRAYVKSLGVGPIYTPQAVINGTNQALGSSKKDIDEAIQQSAAALDARRVPVRFLRGPASIIIAVGGAIEGATVKDATVWLAVVQRSGSVPIKRGENSGKALTYTNIVRQLTPIGLWNGKPLNIQLAQAAFMRPEVEDLIILIQENGAGPIIGAARLSGT